MLGYIFLKILFMHDKCWLISIYLFILKSFLHDTKWLFVHSFCDALCLAVDEFSASISCNSQTELIPNTDLNCFKVYTVSICM